MREKPTSIAITAALLFAMGAASSQAAQLVQECAPPGGVWGPGNTFRSKIEKYSDNTIVYMSQNFSQADKTKWFRSAPLPPTGGPFTNGMGTQSTIVVEGDGYRVNAPGRSDYHAHFSCVAAPR